MISVLEISARDPVIARDGRPFGAGQGHRMKSLEWLYPSVVAGMVRTLLGNKNGGRFDAREIEDLKRISISGPLPKVGSQLFFPAPLDVAVQEGEDQRIVCASRPRAMATNEGTDLPSNLIPALLPANVGDFKPARIPPFWSAARMTEWLTNVTGKGFQPPGPQGTDSRILLSREYLKMEKEQRFHVRIEPATYAAQPTQLFMTTGIAIPDEVRLSVQVESDDSFASHLQGLDEWAALGGERRMVRVTATQESHLWTCPEKIKTSLANTNLVRMVLATPALFKDGWKPGWIRDDGTGELAGITLRLVGACVERWRPISGWSYEKPRGPKPGLRLAPAGSVYFFQADGNASLLADQWLKPVSDFAQDGQSRRDGFGLALWGVWAQHE